MNSKKSFFLSGILIILVIFLTAIISCETKPTEPKNDNIFDPLNPLTGGDPFNLTARIGEGRLILEWNTPNYKEPKFYKIYRSEQEDINYLFMDTIDIDLNKYYDKTALNGYTYYYKINITLANDTESSMDALEPAKIYIPKDTDRPPTALFSISLGVDNAMQWHFDATASSDFEDGTNIEYRWNFDCDVNWDTDWLEQDTISFTYSDTGDYHVTLSVRDQSSFTDEISKWIRINPLVMDIDGNFYPTIKIGDQLWMAKNLRVTRYNNGDAINNITIDAEWGDQIIGAYCSYDNDYDNVNKYGLLYNWYTIDDIRQLAPSGWHVPSDGDWKELEMYLGMSKNEAYNTGWRGANEGSKLKERTGWSHNGNGTNESGFSARPAGHRYDNINGAFSAMGIRAYYWSATNYNSVGSWGRYLNYSNSNTCRHYYNKRYGFSVRCIKD